MEEFERLKKLKLESVIRQAEKDYEKGRYVIETADEHFKKLGI